MWARIDNGAVAELTDIDPAGRFHPSIQWVECGDDTATGWQYDGEECIPPPPEPPENLTARKRAEIDTASVEALADVRSAYPDYEQLSWERQEREARDGGGPLIEAIAEARGLELEELISRIIAKADAYQAAAGAVIGQRQALHDQLAAVLANEDLDDDAKREAIEGMTW